VLSEPSHDYRVILRRLVSHGVEFLVVGGVAAVLNGAPYITFDLDIVHSRQPANIERLLAALADMDAHYRFRPEVRPNASHVSAPGHNLLHTRLGPIDVLGEIGASEGYEQLLPHCTLTPLSEDLTVQVLNLDKLIQVKEQAGRDKDLAALPVLRRTLEERNRR
jgi:hypothetical protein